MQLKAHLKNTAKFVYRRLNIDTLRFYFNKRSCILEVNDKTVRDSYEGLRKASEDTGSSCIAENKLEPFVDLQIIIPVFNSEAFLRACLDSALTDDTDVSYLVTVVNDGSTDSSGDIIEEYRGNPHIDIITQSNKGFSEARNAGLKIIKGKYLYFLDSDDRVDIKEILAMLKLAVKEDADIVQSSFAMTDCNGNISGITHMKSGEAKSESDLFGYPWGKVFKASLFKNIRFPKNYWFQDSINNQIIFALADKAYGYPGVSYYYRSNPSGITKVSKTKVKSLDAFYITKRLYNDRVRLGLPIDQEYYKYILHMAVLIYVRTERLPEELKKNLFICLSDFICKNFAGLNPPKEYLPLEKAILNHDYGTYKAYCKYIRK